MQQDHYFILSSESGNALVDENGVQIVPSNSWFIYSVNTYYLGVIDEGSGAVIQYIDKRTGEPINRP